MCEPLGHFRLQSVVVRVAVTLIQSRRQRRTTDRVVSYRIFREYSLIAALIEGKCARDSISGTAKCVWNTAIGQQLSYQRGVRRIGIKHPEHVMAVVSHVVQVEYNVARQFPLNA